MSKHVVLPDEREAQLRKIADAHKVTVADAVALLMGWAIEHGKVAPGIPGIDVRRERDHIEIDFGDFTRTMPLELARAFATTLRWFAKPKASGVPSVVASLAQEVSGAHLVGISRRGTSIKIAGENGGERTLAPSIARELAGLIETAAGA